MRGRLEKIHVRFSVGRELRRAGDVSAGLFVLK